MGRYQKLMKYSSLLVILFVGIYFIYIWKEIPESIGTHFGFDGVINGRGNKVSILSYPLIVGLVVMLCYYGIQSLLEKVKDMNLLLCEHIAPFLHCVVQTLVFFLLVMLSYMMIASANDRNLGSWFGIVMVVGMIGSIFVGCVGSFITWRKFK